MRSIETTLFVKLLYEPIYIESADNIELDFSYALRLSLLTEEDEIAFAGVEVMDCAVGKCVYYHHFF